jgi:uncharacterized protein YndB with AHSA1/START domain
VPAVARFELERTIPAPLDAVWELVTDHRGIGDWGPARKSTLEREGDPAPNGLGAIRKISAIGPAIREEVVLFEPPSRFAYTLLSGAPVRDYRADVELAPDGEGTRVRWTVSCRPLVPGIQLILRGAVTALLASIAREAKRRQA